MTFSRSTTVHRYYCLLYLVVIKKKKNNNNKKRLESFLPSNCFKLQFIPTNIPSFSVACMTPDERKENNVSFLPQLIHHCDNAPWDVQLTFFLHSTFNHFSVQSILTGMCWKLHHLILHIVFTCSLPGAHLGCYLVTYLWYAGTVAAWQFKGSSS